MTEPLDITAEIKTLSDTISQPLPKEAEGLLMEAEYRASWLARVGEMEADAEAAVNRKRGEVADNFAHLSATLFREKLAGETADLQRIQTLAHRLYSTLTEQIELIRSSVSYLKTQNAHSQRPEGGR